MVGLGTLSLYDASGQHNTYSRINCSDALWHVWVSFYRISSLKCIKKRETRSNLFLIEPSDFQQLRLKPALFLTTGCFSFLFQREKKKKNFIYTVDNTFPHNYTSQQIKKRECTKGSIKQKIKNIFQRYAISLL